MRARIPLLGLLMPLAVAFGVGADRAATAAGRDGTRRMVLVELYTSQGLHDRAADVYRALLNQRPGDANLQARLREAEAASRGETARVEPVSIVPDSAPAPAQMMRSPTTLLSCE